MLSSRQLKLLSSLKLRKFREKEGRFLIEGFHLIHECLLSPFTVEQLILRKGVNLAEYSGIYRTVKERRVPTEIVQTQVFKKLSETVNSQGIIGVVGMPQQPKSAAGDIILALDSISDPGNLGTIIRTAYWFGIKTIILSKNSVDPFNSKVIRSSQGGLFHVGLVLSADLSSELRSLESEGFTVILFTPGSEEFLEDIKPAPMLRKCAAVFGNEARGTSANLLEAGFRRASIRGFSGCESLNVAVSCGIVLNHLKQLTLGLQAM
jgi:TrmH family RNA methyltransferase